MGDISYLNMLQSVNGKKSWLPHLSFKISLKDTSFHIFINFLGFYLSPECLFSFLSNFYIPPCVGNTFMEFAFVENALIWGIFTHASPLSKLATKFLSSRPDQKEITHSSRQHFVSHNIRKGEGDYYLLYQNSVRKCEGDLEH